MRKRPDPSLEIVILFVLGMFMVVFGLLLIDIHAGRLPYNPDGTYGLFLVITAFQIITLGKTPFGDFRRSWALVAAGLGAALLGMACCFVPGLLSGFVRGLVGAVLLAGGLCLLVQLLADGRKARLWLRTGGVLRQLTLACGLVYGLSVLAGLVTLLPAVATPAQVAALLLAYGASFFYLAWRLCRTARAYPPQARAAEAPLAAAGRGLFRSPELPLSLAILLLLAILLTALGVLLVPVGLGVLPFSADGQLGLLLTIMAIQMMALGDTPLGQFERSWPVVILGAVCAGLGIVSSIVPGLLTGLLQRLLGVLNLAGGGFFLAKRFLLREAPLAHVRKLDATQTALNGMAMMFGLSMLLPGLVPGPVTAAILVVNGVLLFTLASLLAPLSEWPFPHR